MPSKNNSWYVITGASCSGKTTLIEDLQKRGYMVIYEVARTYIDEQLQKGKTIEEIRKDELKFQQNVLKKKISIEKKLPKNKIIFLDRGIPDTYAYDKLHKVKENSLLDKAVENCKYKKIFLLDKLPYEKDYARIETKEEQDKLHRFLKSAYHTLGFEIVRVPALPIAERVDFVLKNL